MIPACSGEWIEVTGVLRQALIDSAHTPQPLRDELQLPSVRAWMRERTAAVDLDLDEGDRIYCTHGQVVVLRLPIAVGVPAPDYCPLPRVTRLEAAADSGRLPIVGVMIILMVVALLVLACRCHSAELAGDRGAEAAPAGRWVRAVLTAYSPLDELTRDDVGNPRRLTATGVATARAPYGVAADPAALPYGTRVVIPAGLGYVDQARAGDRVFAVDDTGAIVRRRTRETGVLHLDLRYRTVASAAAFGVRQTLIYVLDG